MPASFSLSRPEYPVEVREGSRLSALANLDDATVAIGSVQWKTLQIRMGGLLAHSIRIKLLVGSSFLLNSLACAALGWGNSRSLAIIAIVALGIGCGVPYAGVFNRAAALFLVAQEPRWDSSTWSELS